MAKHQQYQQQSFSKPQTQAVTPTPPKAPAPEPEPRWWLALGTVDKKHAVAWMKTQGTRVLECHYLDSHYGPMPVRDAFQAEDTWEEASYSALYRGEAPRTVKQGMLEFGKAIGLHKANGKTAAVEVEVEGNRLLSEEGKVVYLGGQKDAWDELQAYAAHNLLPNWQAERRSARRRS